MTQNYNHLIKFLNHNNYAVSKDDFYKQFSSHPDFPSLYAITDTFKFLGIENIAAKVPKEEFENLPDTFLAVIKDGDSKDIVYVKKNSLNEITYSSEGKTKKLNSQDFLDIWQEIIVAIEPNESIEKKTSFKEKRIQYSVASLSLIISFIYIAYSNPSFSGITYFILSCLGLVLSILIVKESLGFHSAAVSKICNSSNQTSCSEVIFSKGAQIMPFLSLSDLCLVYFFSLILINVINPLGFNDIIFLIISVISILFSIYSLYYQGMVIKKWCMLCLGINFILLLQFLFVAFSYQSLFNILNVLALLTSFAITVSIWLAIKPEFSKLKSLKSMEIDFLKLKRNRKIFNLALEKERKFEQEELKNLVALKLGSADAKEIVHGILSPSCGHCIKAFKDYMELSKLNNIQLRLIFNINPENKDNEFLKIAHTVLNLLINEGNQESLSALEEWYNSEFNSKLLNEKYNFTGSHETFTILEQQYNWCKKNEINYTPATIFRDHLFPMEFNFSDIVFFVDDENS